MLATDRKIIQEVLRKEATKCCVNQGGFFFSNKLIMKKTQMQLPG